MTIFIFSILFFGAMAQCSAGSFFPCDEEERKKMIKFLKVSFFALPLLVFSILFPSENTLVKMIVAQNITPNNIEAVVKEGVKLKEGIKKDVLDIIMAIKEEKK